MRTSKGVFLQALHRRGQTLPMDPTWPTISPKPGLKSLSQRSQVCQTYVPTFLAAHKAHWSKAAKLINPKGKIWTNWMPCHAWHSRKSIRKFFLKKNAFPKIDYFKIGARLIGSQCIDSLLDYLQTAVLVPHCYRCLKWGAVDISKTLSILKGSGVLVNDYELDLSAPLLMPPAGHSSSALLSNWFAKFQKKLTSAFVSRYKPAPAYHLPKGL